MFYICAVCMVRRSPLFNLNLNPAHKNILESIVSPVIDTTILKDTVLLLCKDCNVLLEAVEKFHKTVLVGFQYLVNLHKQQLQLGCDEEGQKCPEWLQEKEATLLFARFGGGTAMPPEKCPTTETEVKTELEPDWIPQNSAPEETPTILCTKKETEDSIVKHEDSDAEEIVPTTIKKEPAAEQKAVGQSATEDSLLRSRRLELTEELDLKSEPASEPEEPEQRDSESTVTCDEDQGAEEDYRLVRLRQQSESRVAVTHTPSARGEAAAGREGDDTNTLLVALIFGVMGACRREELYNVQFDDVQIFDKTILVTVRNTKTKTDRTFTVTGSYCDLCKKYMELRPKTCSTSNFFINYTAGKCTNQQIGINKFGTLGKTIAKYLNLPDPEMYTGHCFRRTSATLLVGGWRSTAVAEGYIDESMKNKVNVSNQIFNSIQNKEIININMTPSSSTSNQDPPTTIQPETLNISHCSNLNVNYNYYNK